MKKFIITLSLILITSIAFGQNTYHRPNYSSSKQQYYHNNRNNHNHYNRPQHSRSYNNSYNINNYYIIEYRLRNGIIIRQIIYY